jgi:hypothetical protein
MSIINKPPEMVKSEYELQDPGAQAVEKYALFIQSTPDHVVNSALKMVIWKDAEFRRWRKQQQSNAERKEGAATAKAAKA